MLRITKKVFNDLALWMIGLGLAMGVVFPFFVVLMGVSSEKALTPGFFAACMAAGFLVGAANIALARGVVGKRLRLLAQRMRVVENNLKQMADGVTDGCAAEDCYITIDSEDEIGESAMAFNQLVGALTVAHSSEGAVREFSRLLASRLELDTLAGDALRQLMDNSKAGAGALLVESEGLLEVAASHGLKDPESLDQSDHVRAAMRGGQRQLVRLPADLTVNGVLAEFRPQEVLVDPVRYKSVPIGALVLASGEPFGAEGLRNVELLRPALALALNNALAHERLQRLAALDPLTGVFNRRFGLGRLREEFSRAVRDGSPLGVVMFDLDHFKKVNDTYGHLVGDRVLVHLAKLARTVMREGDVLVRYGGEEFLAILPAAALSDSQLVAERLRRLLGESVVKDGQQEIRVTLSAGVASTPEHSVDNPEGLVGLADKALYAAKDAGRDRVRSA
ncbi:MAG: GGDEF domain-containing protein [Desulfarculaceae bacterium]|nr:GGDEF domain-containing protein [Desulfarculaceae bacterium]MCF8073831.1 GGDEF domain-containing protein [Desulfarculaceae bacterium]MCF8102811.1 GGDEF domain-containing protein [Desulfarculaceae bacterium]MCF8116255.1 GGDEF domain-containing protein [Desulfarculaceae bacterium]